MQVIDSKEESKIVYKVESVVRSEYGFVQWDTSFQRIKQCF